MPKMHHLSFSPFRLDPASQQLWRGAEVVPLRPKAFLLLRYLAEHPKRLVSQEELLKAVWQHSHLSDGLLRGYIRDCVGPQGCEKAHRDPGRSCRVTSLGDEGTKAVGMNRVLDRFGQATPTPILVVTPTVSV